MPGDGTIRKTYLEGGIIYANHSLLLILCIVEYQNLYDNVSCYNFMILKLNLIC